MNMPWFNIQYRLFLARSLIFRFDELRHPFMAMSLSIIFEKKDPTIHVISG